MPKIKKDSNSDLKKFLEYQVKKSGFSLENNVAKILSKDYSVTREVPFFDKDEEKGRRYDVRAFKYLPDESKLSKDVLHILSAYNLIIECKNIPGNVWVFSKAEPTLISLPEHASMRRGLRDPVFNISPYEEISSIQYASGFAEYIFDEKKSNKKNTNLSSAIFSITKATSYEKEKYQKTFEQFKKMGWPRKQSFVLMFCFLQPVIIFSGKIFVAFFNKKGIQEFKQVPAVQIPRSYVGKGYEEIGGDIHVITYKYLKTYLKDINKFYLQNEPIIIKNQKTFFEALKEVMPAVPSNLKTP